MDAAPAETATLESLWAAISPGTAVPPVQFTGVATLDSPFAVSELAAAAIAVAGCAAAGFVAGAGATAGATAVGSPAAVPDVVSVDRSLADAWFRRVVLPVGWETPNPWDSLADEYRTADGWIRLHTNAPHHRLAALLALGVTDRSVPRTAARSLSRGARNLTEPRDGAGVEPRELTGTAPGVAAAIDPQEPAPPRDPIADAAEERAEVEAAVRTWAGEQLEAEVVEAGGAAAVLRTVGEWERHPQGVAVAAEPLISWRSTTASRAPIAASMAGIRVLDLTRVIAGPVATRFLAGLGAEVLRIDPPDWDESGVVADMTLGKRSARMNFYDAGAMRKLTALIKQADVVVHGYRADALERLGLGDDELAELKPGLVTVAINAYGWSGPWRNRRGFDSLVQCSTGISFAGGDRPTPLPVQALDHATGYLAAAAALEGLRRRRETGLGQAARLSLTRTARELLPGGAPAAPAPELATDALDTPWGPARLLASPVTIAGVPLHWALPPRDLGADAARFQDETG